jgi:DNA-binding response OmpR family regulator
MGTDVSGTILHVDDEAQVRTSLALLMRAENYDVRSAATGAEAIAWVADGLQPDVLIVDFQLGEEMDGADLTQELRRTLGYTPPIILLTGDPSNAEVPWTTEVPVWLAQKPVNPELLVAAMAGLVQLSRAVRDLVRTSPRTGLVRG